MYPDKADKCYAPLPTSTKRLNVESWVWKARQIVSISNIKLSSSIRHSSHPALRSISSLRSSCCTLSSTLYGRSAGNRAYRHVEGVLGMCLDMSWSLRASSCTFWRNFKITGIAASREHCLAPTASLPQPESLYKLHTDNL